MAAMVLTPDQVAVLKAATEALFASSGKMAGLVTVEDLCDSHEELRQQLARVTTEKSSLSHDFNGNQLERLKLIRETNRLRAALAKVASDMDDMRASARRALATGAELGCLGEREEKPGALYHATEIEGYCDPDGLPYIHKSGMPIGSDSVCISSICPDGAFHPGEDDQPVYRFQFLVEAVPVDPPRVEAVPVVPVLEKK
jgi:hypothetical protein